jgi:hypothetical protein
VSVLGERERENDVQYDYTEHMAKDRTGGPQNPDFTRPQLEKR